LCFSYFLRQMGVAESFVRLETRAMLKYGVRSREHGFQATLENELATGTVFTTLRNCWLNYCIHRSFLFVNPGLTSTRTLILGDDMLCSFLGSIDYLAKRYSNFCARVYMIAEAKRTEMVSDCTFLSKSLFRDWNSKIWCAPLLGKALARFNVRATSNAAIPDDAYMFMKSMSYAYEFRYVEPMRDLFMRRSLSHADAAARFFDAARNKALFIDQVEREVLSWQYRQRGLKLKQLAPSIAHCSVIEEGCYAMFLQARYGLSADHIYSAAEEVILGRTAMGLDGPVLSALSADFI